ncbi:MAG: AAA family ATPase [Wenzhouxiangella sp.]|nr:AAA family ATPase [Wenzhouxiangella sp.]
MPAPKPLSMDRLYRSFPAEHLDFVSTDTLDELALPWGQEQAMRALEFGAAIANHGFNLYVMATRGTGARELVQAYLKRRAEQAECPPDWCYVFNFKSPEEPLALSLPAGEGHRFRADLQMLIDELRSGVAAVFESEEFQGRLQELQDEFNERQQQSIDEIGEEAARDGIALISTPTGFTLAPMRDGDVIDPDEYEKLDADERKRIEARIVELQRKLQQAVQQMPRLRKQLRKRIRALNEEMMAFALGGPMGELKERWSHLPAVLEHLERVREDVVENAGAFHGRRGAGPPGELLDSYRANLLVDNSDLNGAPVVYEDLTNHHHLVGRMEHQVRDGALYTDFSMIRAGALHRANGGYLLLDVRRVLTHPMAWESLKRVLSAGEIRIESLERTYGLASTTSLQPACIPLSIKVVLLGDRLLYYLLAHYDPDFGELFKVEADFEDQIEWREEDGALHVRLVATLARGAGIRPLDGAATGRLIEHASRLAGDQRKITARDRLLRDVLMEADHWAASAGAVMITREHLEQALDESRARVDRVRRRALEQIQRGIVMVATSGEVVGQVNGLAGSRLGKLSFGLPARITATARPGRGQIVDIEREAKLGGPIHSKAVMILSRYIASRFAASTELSLSASLAFEQNYGGIEGDSASVAEVCALLSAIARVPLKQSLAVTGSINQHGEVQAVGGVNEKIEGFFDVCANAGLVDGQGVLMPASNIDHLMLDARVREAVAAGRFAIYPIRRVEEAIELLTGMAPGEPDNQGEYPEDSFGRRVAERLAEFTRINRPDRSRSRQNGAGPGPNQGDGSNGSEDDALAQP